jgi:hypothetical protein
MVLETKLRGSNNNQTSGSGQDQLLEKPRNVEDGNSPGKAIGERQRLSKHIPSRFSVARNQPCGIEGCFDGRVRAD